MSNALLAARAYAAGAAHRSIREQEAAVFRRASAALRRAGCDMARVRAIADNERLWSTVSGLVRDPANALPPGVCGSLASIAIAVQREMRAASPDLGWLAGINDSIAGGLEQRAR